MGFDMSILKQPKSDLIKKMIFALLGDIILGFGIAFNSCAGLGNDPISVFYSGVSNALHVNLGLASNIANYTMFIVVLILGRRYINIGTFIYTLPLGSFINLGVALYGAVFPEQTLAIQVASAIVGCLLLFLGISVFISAEIGVDPWTGLALILKDATKKKYMIFKVLIDIIAFLVGFLMGGAIGVTTVVAAFLGGPIIQKMDWFIKKYIFKYFKFKSSKIEE